MRVNKRTAFSFFSATLCINLAACATPVPVNRPCGVITDSLRDVQGKDAAERRRIDIHFERGVAAKCWPRNATVGSILGEAFYTGGKL
jgi:hypothetical protein